MHYRGGRWLRIGDQGMQSAYRLYGLGRTQRSIGQAPELPREANMVLRIRKCLLFETQVR